MNINSPEINPDATFNEICDEDGTVIGVNKPVWTIYKYNFTMTLFEERYNILVFKNGNAALKYAR